MRPARSTRILTATFWSRQAPAADRRWSRRFPRGRWAAGRDGRTQAVLARQLFVRSGSCAGQPGLQALPSDRARKRAGNCGGLHNKEIAKNADYGDYSLDQSKLAVEDFYDRMDDVMSPAPLDPMRALKEAITALEEQVKARVKSVDNGRQVSRRGRREVDMPDGASIFETTGAWEDFATPSRDLRLLIAVDVVRGFPDRVARRPERYAMPRGKAQPRSRRNGTTLASELSAREFSYTRTDGSQWT